MCHASCTTGYGGPVQETRRGKPVFPTVGERDGIGRKHPEMYVQGNHDLRESGGQRRAYVSSGFIGSWGKSKAMRYGKLEPRVSRAIETSARPLAERHSRER